SWSASIANDFKMAHALSRPRIHDDIERHFRLIVFVYLDLQIILARRRRRHFDYSDGLHFFPGDVEGLPIFLGAAEPAKDRDVGAMWLETRHAPIDPATAQHYPTSR